MNDLVGIFILGGFFLILLLIIFIKTNLVICQPNEILIISGRKHVTSAGEQVGYRVLKGGRGFKLPIIESISRLPLTAIPIEIHLVKALCKGIIPINIDGRANIKIAGSEADGLFNAIERFLGRNMNDVAQIAKQTLEGSLRGVLATFTPEEANSERIVLADRVVTEARNDLRKLGLVLDYFKIQNISDEQGYLEAIGRQKNADVIKNARIAEATAEAEARKIAAEQKKIASVAEAEAEEIIVQADNKLAVHRAQLTGITNRETEKSRLAGDIARTEEEKVLEKERIELNRRRYEADLVIPADAQKRAAELRAAGEASKILENGKATAEAINRMREQWQEGMTRDLFLIQMLPELLDKVTRVVAENLHIDKVTVFDSGNGQGVPSHVKNLTGSVITILEQLKNATGLDVPDLLQNMFSGNNKPASHIHKELP